MDTELAEKLTAHEKLLADVTNTFWIFFVFYVVASLAWIAICFCNYQREIRNVEKKIHENEIARSLELE
ncbi:unnamed protein product [Caenorhabditis bovis]|uniref:Uncharacterized protein n=1 Tax=Caenorhabditis bovis TaxID=2654633 RepID=A0A8S1EP27_9PELO|nr:unnamed protein product [Caenorhabditis bovis]